jgi:hypothetical protein
MDKPKDINKFILAWLIVGGFFAMTAYLLYLLASGKEVAESTIISLIVGALIAKFTSVCDYFFGSTQGSADKTASMVDMAKAGDFSKPPCPPEVKDGKPTV